MVQPRVDPINSEEVRAVHEAEAFLDGEALDCAHIPLTWFTTLSRSLPGSFCIWCFSRRCNSLRRSPMHCKVYCQRLTVLVQSHGELHFVAGLKVLQLRMVQPRVQPIKLKELRAVYEAKAFLDGE